MHAVVINKEPFKDLIAQAKKNIVEVNERTIKTLKPIGDNPKHVVYLGPHYKIVFSIERQPLGLIKHLSMSCMNRGGKLPAIEFVNQFLKILGFEFPDVKKNQVWIEDDNAINVAGK